MSRATCASPLIFSSCASSQLSFFSHTSPNHHPPQYRMIRPPQNGSVLISQFVRDCSRPPFVGTNKLLPGLNPNADPSTLYPALYASPWNVANCVPSFVNDTYFGYYSPNMFISGPIFFRGEYRVFSDAIIVSGTWAMPDFVNRTSGTIYAFGQNECVRRRPFAAEHRAPPRLRSSSHMTSSHMTLPADARSLLRSQASAAAAPAPTGAAPSRDSSPQTAERPTTTSPGRTPRPACSCRPPAAASTSASSFVFSLYSDLKSHFSFPPPLTHPQIKFSAATRRTCFSIPTTRTRGTCLRAGPTASGAATTSRAPSPGMAGTVKGGT